MIYSIKLIILINILFYLSFVQMGIGDWGLGIGDWGLGPIPNPQSPIPNPQSPLFFLFEFNNIILKFNKYYMFYNYKLNKK